MSGFTGILSEKIQILPKNIDSKICKHWHKDAFSINQNTINKFCNDKVFFEKDGIFFLTEGIILNSSELCKKYSCSTMEDLLTVLYKNNGSCFFNEFRGSFSGLTYNSLTGELIVYTDHIGSKQVFYSTYADGFFFSSSINDLIELFKKHHKNFSLNIQSAYCILTFGFLVEKNTMFNEINKLEPGHYLSVKNGKIYICQYFKLKNTPNYNVTETEAIEEIDTRFRKSVTRAFEKDNEYGYKHIVALSGGLDSRMTTWIAHELGYSDKIINYTFSQSDYLDETIPKKIAADLKHEWIFKSLDNGLFLKNVESVVELSFGGALYYGLAHGKSLFDLLNFDNLGIVHTGQLGDVVVGTSYSSLDCNKASSLKDGAYSTALTYKLPENLLSKEYENEEIFKFYTRYFSGTNQGLLPLQEITETYSPFYDIDFMEYCLSLPVKMRFEHKIYHKWILKKYPKAAQYVWEKIGTTIDHPQIKLLGKSFPLKKLPNIVFKKILRNMGIKVKSGRETSKHMNPLEYWYNSNDDLRIYFEDYFNKNITLADSFNELGNDCRKIWNNQTMIEKVQVMTLLAFLRIYFPESN